MRTCEILAAVCRSSVQGFVLWPVAASVWFGGVQLKKTRLTRRLPLIWLAHRFLFKRNSALLHPALIFRSVHTAIDRDQSVTSRNCKYRVEVWISCGANKTQELIMSIVDDTPEITCISDKHPESTCIDFWQYWPLGLYVHLRDTPDTTSPFLVDISPSSFLAIF